MVKIREIDYPYETFLWVEMYHLGPDGYAAGLYGYDPDLGVMLPPWEDLPEPATGHLLFTPQLMPYNPYDDTWRQFDRWRWDEGLGDWVLNEQAAWDFYHEMLGNPYRMISRCRWCFPHGHRYLTI